MPGTVIVGLQWGDEGKGKLVDSLAPRFDAVVRFQGGSNAGHTVVVAGKKMIFHVMPSAALQNKLCVVGSGVAVDTAMLLEEIEAVKRLGVEPKLLVSSRAQVTTSLHKIHDGLEEARRGKGAVGTTRRGVGPTYSDKTLRIGVRVADLLNEETLRDKLSLLYDLKSRIFRYVYGYEKYPELDDVLRELVEHGEKLRPYVANTEYVLNDMLKKGGRILFEGAQGTLLDIDLGTYPYTTSSNTVAAAASVGSGVPINEIKRVIGVAKSYTTRVGGGPFPTEDTGEAGKLMREAGGEYGATTGRPRRCGWFDGVATRYAAMINGVDSLILTKLDVLSRFSKVKLATAYRIDGRVVDEMPATAEELGKAEPVYEELDGWKSYGSGFWSEAKRNGFAALPKPLREYIKRLEELVGAPVRAVSYGPSRDEFLDFGLDV